MKIKRIITFLKGLRKKIKNQNNEDQTGKYNNINLDWRIKLKTNKILQIEKKNQKNIDQVEKYNICKLRLNDKIKNK